MFEVSIVIKDNIVGIYKKYKIPNDFLLHVPRSEDRVTSGLAGCLAMMGRIFMPAFVFSCIPWFGMFSMPAFVFLAPPDLGCPVMIWHYSRIAWSKLFSCPCHLRDPLPSCPCLALTWVIQAFLYIKQTFQVELGCLVMIWHCSRITWSKLFPCPCHLCDPLPSCPCLALT